MTGKRLLLFGGVGLLAAVAAVVTVVIVQTLRSDDVNLETSAPVIPTQTSTQTSNAGDPPSQSTSGGEVLRFVVDASGSKATYVVREKLAALPVETNAVGETSAISGEIYLTKEGLASGAKSTFQVDLRTLRSDESRRDNFVANNTLQANRFPFAEFVVESVSGFPANYVDGEEVSLELTGSMTIHGVTKPVTFAVKARQQGDTLTAIADTQFKMTDFGITPPNVQIARSQDEVQLQVVLFAKQAAV